MKKILAFAVLFGLLFSINSNAQDAKAKSILEKVSAKYKAAKNIQADFAFTINSTSGKAQSTKKGKFYMQGDEYKIDLGSQQILCDGKTVWTYLVDDKEVQVSNYNPAEQSISPSKLFSGSYEKEYNYSYKQTKTISGKSVDVIELKPKKAQSFSKVQLYVDKSTNMVSGGQMFEKNGSSYTYTISNVKLNTNLNSSDFKFNEKKHPGVEVIDLR